MASEIKYFCINYTSSRQNLSIEYLLKYLPKFIFLFIKSQEKIFLRVNNKHFFINYFLKMSTSLKNKLHYLTLEKRVNAKLVREFNCFLSSIKSTHKRKLEYQEAFCRWKISLSRTRRGATASVRLRRILLYSKSRGSKSKKIGCRMWI